MSKIEIYQTKNGQTAIDVTFDKETIWLNQNQLAELFNIDRTSIVKHINNIYNTVELIKDETCAKIAQVKIEGNNKVSRKILHYNLDVIISVGYRVNSIQGTQFRIWTTQRLKENLVKGYSINKQRLEELKQTIQLIKSSSKYDELNGNEAKGLLEVINNYTQSFVLLNQFDSYELSTSDLNEEIIYDINYVEASNAIAKLKSHLKE